MNNFTTSRFYPHVIAGGAVLDERHSEWYYLFSPRDLDKLNMNDHEGDVLGILAKKDTYIANMSHYDSDTGMACPNDVDEDEDYARLTDAWRDYIHLRQSLPPVPQGYTFIGAGGLITPPESRVDAYCAYYGNRDWNHIQTASIDGCDLYYCVNDDYAERYIDALKEYHIRDKTEAETSLTLREDGDGVTYQGYDLSEDDIGKLVEFVGYTTTLRDAGFVVEINEVSVGCMKFTRTQLVELHEEYLALKQQRDVGFTVTLGDRVEYLPDNEVYIVACTSASDYQLISLSSGNRWNSTSFVKHPENYRAIPFKDFLTYEETIDQWRKV